MSEPNRSTERNTGRAAGRSASRVGGPAHPSVGIGEQAGPGIPAARPASEPAAEQVEPVEQIEQGENGGDWLSLADRIAAHATNFLDALAALGRGEAGDEIVPLLLLEVAQVMLAGAQLGASRDVIPSGNAEPDVGADPDLDELRTGLAERLAACDEYAELFDPYRDSKPTSFRLSDDLAAIAADLIHGLRHHQAGRAAEALWWWQYSYVNQWGTHGGAALRALHAVVAHARLDVAEEEVPG